MIFEPVPANIFIIKNKSKILQEKLAELGLLGLTSKDYQNNFFNIIKQTQEYLFNKSNGTETIILTDYVNEILTDPMLPILPKIIKTETYKNPTPEGYIPLGIIEDNNLNKTIMFKNEYDNLDEYEKLLNNMIIKIKNDPQYQ